MSPLVIAMAGLPGSGKSTLARALAAGLDALVWDKDEVRALLFPGRTDRAVNDACMEFLYRAVPNALAQKRVLVIDGRPFSERVQRDRARQAATDAGATIAFVVCTAPVETLKARVELGAHPAPDRDAALVERVSARMEAFDGEEIVIDTGRLAPGEAMQACVEALRRRNLVD